MKNMQIIVIAVVFVVIAGGVFVLYGGYGYGPTGDNQTSTSENQVIMQNLVFSPGQRTVSVGTTITWTNNDSVVHSVITSSGPESFDSGDIARGGTYMRTFTVAGTYNYYCKYHAYMTGTITVQ